MSEPVEVITGATPPAPVNSGKRIAVLDCETQSGMKKLTRMLYETGRLHAVAGCSGLAEALAAALCGQTCRFFTAFAVRAKRSRRPIGSPSYAGA